MDIASRERRMKGRVVAMRAHLWSLGASVEEETALPTRKMYHQI
jgi:hypothetical protein